MNAYPRHLFKRLQEEVVSCNGKLPNARFSFGSGFAVFWFEPRAFVKPNTFLAILGGGWAKFLSPPILFCAFAFETGSVMNDNDEDETDDGTTMTSMIEPLPPDDSHRPFAVDDHICMLPSVFVLLFFETHRKYTLSMFAGLARSAIVSGSPCQPTVSCFAGFTVSQKCYETYFFKSKP